MQKIVDILSGIACFIVFVMVAFELGFDINPEMTLVIHQWAVAYFGVDIALRVFFQKKRIKYFLLHPFDLAIGLTALSRLFPGAFFLGNPLWLQAGLLLISVGRLPHLIGLVKRMPVNPSQSLVLGFLMSIFIGGVFLSLPIAVQPGVNLGFLDALFISTSAVCVTGLTTLNIGETFSTVGQVIIMVLIQLGGLGIMSFSVLLSIVLYKKVTHGEGDALQGNFESNNTSESSAIIKAIFKYTLFFELIGAAILCVLWLPEFPNTAQGVFYALFHAISAFCNAGFSLFPDSFTGFAMNSSVLLTISGLIMLGGLGFPIMLNIVQHRLSAFRSKNLKLQTKLALSVSAFLWVVGTAVIWMAESNNALAGLPLWDQGVLSFFHSVSARTAGFTALDLTVFHPSTILVIMILMYIGVSPGSTGGGIKTTTFGILVLTLWGNLTQTTKIAIFGRTITVENSIKALAIVTLSGILIFSGVFFLLFSDAQQFLITLFEVLSAFSTTGLSLGMTDGLSNGGKKIIMVMMFLGRTGPLTVGFALARHRKQKNYSYPEERIMVA